MQIGLTWNGGRCADYAAVAALRPQWFKTSVSPDAAARNYSCKLQERYGDLLDGSRVIVDLRTESVQSFLSHPARGRGAGVYDWFVDWVGEVVHAHRDTVKHWELWGEAACPFTGEGFVEADGRALYEGMTYAELISRVYPRIKEADPEAIVLCGGHGCDTGAMPYSMNLRFYQRICDAGAGEFFDVNNLHPFVLRGRDWPAIEDMYRRGFAEMREIERRNGLAPKPIVGTEFAWPTHAGPPRDYGSAVVTSVMSVSEQEAADWTDRAFRLFVAEGVQVMLWCSYRDTGGKFWGSHIGLVREDGEPKAPLLEMVTRWMEQERGIPVAL
jgi:hypothetical protein